jgi:hypothetical protein
MSFTDTIIVNVFTRQSDLMGQTNPSGLGIGLRHQVSGRVVLDGGIGRKFWRAADRSVLFGTLSFSVGF